VTYTPPNDPVGQEQPGYSQQPGQPAPGYPPPAPGSGYGQPGYGQPPQGYPQYPPTGTGYPAGAVSAYANWGQRVGAYLIDIIPNIVLSIIGSAIGSLTVTLVLDLIILGWTIYNRWYLMGTTGQSWGKRVLNIKLVKEATGQPVGAGMAFVRDICHIVDSIICFVGYLFPLWDAKRQTIADKIVSTVVVPA
jgi:uncharacterized RDD family membrane protein YckC